MPSDPQLIASLIRGVPDFPRPGVDFKDITPLLASPGGFQAAITALVDAAPEQVDVVMGLEARGFIFAAPVALALGAGFVPARKPGKLPGDTHEVTFELEYGAETLTVHADAVRPGSRVMIVDDVLATGGTALAAIELLRRLGAELVQVSVLLELAVLGGRNRLREAGLDQVHAVIKG
ncbi:MAG: adenine phosphoribosyltransferase [Arachnia sp.]